MIQFFRDRIFVSSYENTGHPTSYKQYILRTIEIKDCNFMIDGRNFFGQTVKVDLRADDNIEKIATGQGDDSTTCYLLDYPYFKI